MKIKDRGLDVSSICAHISLIEPDPKQRRDDVAFVEGCIDMAADFDTRAVHCISGSLQPGVRATDAWSWLVENLAEFPDYSTARGVRLGMEAAVTRLVANARDLGRLLRESDTRKVSVNLDPSHLMLFGEDPVDAVKAFGPRIIHVHLKDAKGTPDDFQFPPLGMGVIDFRRFIAALRATGYDGYQSVEYEAEVFGYKDTPEHTTQTSKEYVERLLA